MKSTMLAVIATSATLALNAQAQDASPKGIYRDPATSATTNGIAYRIYAVHGDQKQEVSVRHNFYSADRFKLQLKLKDPAYVYVLNRTFNGEPKELGEKGITTVRDEDRRRQRDQPRYSVLFPAAGEHPVKIEGGRYRDIPGDVLLRMDDTPGLEKLYVIVSDHEIDLRRLYGNAIRFDHGSEDRPEAREGRRSDSEGDVLDRLNKDMSDWAANGQTEGPSGDDKGTSSKGIERDTYTVAPRNKTFMAEITLHHYRD